MNDSPWMTGSQVNSQQVGQNAVVNMAGSIFGAIGANKYVQNHRFKDDDVVIEETVRDNRALIMAGSTFLVLIVVIVILLR